MRSVSSTTLAACPLSATSALNEVRARRAAVHYWQQDYDSIDSRGSRPDRCPAARQRRSAVHRRERRVSASVFAATTPATVQAIDAGIAAQLAVLKNSERNEDAAFNYEYLLRLRAARGAQENRGRRGGDEAGEEKTTHGQPGGAPQRERPYRLQDPHPAGVQGVREPEGRGSKQVRQLNESGGDECSRSRSSRSTFAEPALSRAARRRRRCWRAVWLWRLRSRHRAGGAALRCARDLCRCVSASRSAGELRSGSACLRPRALCILALARPQRANRRRPAVPARISSSCWTRPRPCTSATCPPTRWQRSQQFLRVARGSA